MKNRNQPSRREAREYRAGVNVLGRVMVNHPEILAEQVRQAGRNGLQENANRRRRIVGGAAAVVMAASMIGHRTDSEKVRAATTEHTTTVPGSDYKLRRGEALDPHAKILYKKHLQQAAETAAQNGLLPPTAVEAANQAAATTQTAYQAEQQAQQVTVDQLQVEHNNPD